MRTEGVNLVNVPRSSHPDSCLIRSVSPHFPLFQACRLSLVEMSVKTAGCGAFMTAWEEGQRVASHASGTPLCAKDCASCSCTGSRAVRCPLLSPLLSAATQSPVPPWRLPSTPHRRTQRRRKKWCTAWRCSCNMCRNSVRYETTECHAECLSRGKQAECRNLTVPLLPRSMMCCCPLLRTHSVHTAHARHRLPPAGVSLGADPSTRNCYCCADFSWRH